MDETKPIDAYPPANLLKDVINPWMLGADPEFAVLTPPDVVVANSGQNSVQTQSNEGAIGSDHNGRVWELRPAPSPSAYVVTLNLWKLLCKQEMNKLEKFKWKSGALGGKKNVNSVPGQPTSLQGWMQYYSNPGLVGYLSSAQIMLHAQQAMQQQQQAQVAQAALDTLGGHVHFGCAGLNSAQRIALNAVTTGLLNLDILPHKENTRRLELSANAEYKYGHFDGGDATRDCNGHIEYRCPPSWLDKPGQALMALTCFKLAAARPSSVKWPKEFALKEGLFEWLDALAQAPDIDAYSVMRYITSHGLGAVQADPASDFKPRWRCSTPQEWGK